MPIHIILAASDFTKIKMGTRLIVGQIGEPSSEQTKMGHSKCPVHKTSLNDYEKLWDKNGT